MAKNEEKIDAKKLAEELLNDKTHGAEKVGPKEMKKAQRFAEGYKEFFEPGQDRAGERYLGGGGRREGGLRPL